MIKKQAIKTMCVVLMLLGAALLPLGAGAKRAGDTKTTVQRADGFRPSRDGFSFRNAFQGSPLPAALRNAQSGPLKAVKDGVSDGLPSQFGLCGGMSLAAADFYLAKSLTQERASPPAAGSPLYEYLYQRQMDSMGDFGVMALKFWKWMNLPTRGETGETTARLTAAEIKPIIRRLKARQLVPLGMVLTSAPAGRLWENHQVLGYGVKEKGPGAWDIRIYDPNYPRDDECVLRVTTGVEGAPDEVEVVRVTGKARTTVVRGVFAMPYTARVPPQGLRAEPPKVDARQPDQAEAGVNKPERTKPGRAKGTQPK